jgi:cytochrome c-type biogenesis protein CcmH/NrfF
MIVAALTWLWWTLPSYVIVLGVLVVAVALYRKGRLR